MNRKIVAIAFISLSVLLCIIFYFEEISKSIFDEGILAIMVGVSAIATGLTGVVLSFSSMKVAKFDAIREYFQQGDTPQMIKNRSKIYDMEMEGIEIDQTAAAEVCSLYHFWGMMVSKGYLPLWIFKSSSGYSVIKLFCLLEPHIFERRAITSKHYAEGFEQLAKKIEKKYKHKYVLEEKMDEQDT